jgi:hypothetical protein
MTWTGEASFPPTDTVIPGWKLKPPRVTRIPPLSGPLEGIKLQRMGEVEE